MIESQYVEGETVPSFDDAVSDVINASDDGGGSEMKIAIENFDAKIYRVITTEGLGAYMHAALRLQGLGLKDLLANRPGKNGYDSWFVTTAEMQSQGPVEPVIATDPATDILGELDKLAELPETERQSLVLSRVGQGAFRAQLIGYWQECAVTQANCIPLLKASHIKPWRDADNKERLDVFNGFLLSPALDVAFDAGFITFDSSGKIVFSPAFTGAPAYQLHINSKMRINQSRLRPEHQTYLDYHRREVFRA